MCAIQKLDGGGEGFIAVQATAPQVAGADAAKVRQPFGEAKDALELLELALLVPGRVIEVLAAPGVVGAGGLQVAARRPTDPDVLPRRRDR
jgi:hypothetical protein